MFDIRELCQTSHEISKAAGWLDPPPAVEETVNLIVSELSEALEDYRAHKGLAEVYYEQKAKGHPVEILTREGVKNKIEMEGGGWTLADFKPCGIPIELADVVIRIAQYCGTNKLDLATAYSLSREAHIDPEDIATFGRFQYTTTYFVQDALTTFSRALDVVPLSLALHVIILFCEKNGIDIEAAVKEKEKYNRTRPHKHGGKKI